jgi:hypothetical protein
VTVKTVNQFDTRFDVFWNQIKDKYPVIAIRDSAFLAWRFDRFSRRKYQILLANAGNHMLGYSILQCTTIKGIKTGLIMDLITINESLGLAAADRLITAAQNYFQKQRTLLSMALMAPSAYEYGSLRRAGYIRLPEALNLPVFHFAYFVHGSAREGLNLSAQDWFITFADYESY